MNTEKIAKAYQVMKANEECFTKRFRRYFREGNRQDLEEALTKLSRMKDIISAMEQEIAAEIGK